MYTAEMAREDTKVLSFIAEHQVKSFERFVKEAANKGNDYCMVKYPHLTFNAKDLNSIYKEMHDKRGFHFAYASITEAIGYAFCIGWGDEEDFNVMASKFLSY